MVRSIWNGSISFGLVNIPVRLTGAVREHRIVLHLLSEDGRCRLRRKLYCPETGREYEYAQTTRGYEFAPGQYVVLHTDEIERIKPASARSIEIAEFVNLDDIDPMYFSRPYFLLPDGNAGAYRLLVEAMRNRRKIGVGKLSMREKEYLVALRPLEELLLLETMHFDDEVIREDDMLDAVQLDAIVNDEELSLAERLVDAMSSPLFEPAQYQDSFRERLRSLIERKVRGEEILVEPQPGLPRAESVDVMRALEESLRQAAAASRRRADERERRQRETG